MRKSLTYAQFYNSLHKFKLILDEERFVPDIVLGVHYQGLSFAALLARLLYRPVKGVEVFYNTAEAPHKCERVLLDFDAERLLRDKKILIVDNSLKTGKTLKMIFDAVTPYSQHVKTLVIYKKNHHFDNHFKPDWILFYSPRPRKFLK